MSNYWNRMPYYGQPDASELKRKSAASVKKAVAKGRVLEPVVIEGRTITKSWWGRSWCNNLERYADYGSRIDRGKRYARNGSVIDLKIRKGVINALVQGTRRTPYKVEIIIKPLSKERGEKIAKRCAKRLNTVEKLLNGDFPEELKELFMQRNGLFPTPEEICFDCSCPDWASMCKHVAAALYGVGARLDEKPLLFFELRGIEIDTFIDQSLGDRVEQMLRNADHTGERVMDEKEASGLFGINIF